MKRKSIIFLLSVMSLSFLGSCSDSQAKKWAYSKEDMSSFMSLDANYTQNENDTSTFSADTDIEIFSDQIDPDDVIVFDVDKVASELEKQKKDYADYSVLKAASVPVSDINNLDDKDGFDITFSKNESGSNYAMLLHSSVTAANEYVLVNKYEEKKNDGKTPQRLFEEKYVESNFSWEDGGKFTFQLISNIGMILAGCFSDNPAAAISGVFGILSSFGENFSSDVKLKDVMDQLKETDKKIDDLSNKIDKNTQLLSDEIVRTEALVDQTNLNLLNVSINDFANNSIAKINTFNRNLSDQLNNYYRDYVKKNETINLVLSKNKNGEYESLPLSEITSTASYNFTLNLTDFSNAKKHLESNQNIVEKGFIDELYKDIDAAIASKTDLPEGIDKENLRGFVSNRIYDEFMKDYFSKNVEKAQEYRNLLIDYAQRISGLSGRVSMLSTYLSRLEYMYNFAAEAKDSMLSVCTNLLKNLDMNTAKASQACLYAGITSKELEENYKTTRTNLQKFYKDVTALKDSYSFILSSPLDGGFYKGNYDVSFKNPGNKCTLQVSYDCEKIQLNGTNVSREKEDMSKHNPLSAMQHSRIVTRWDLLKKSGSISNGFNYLQYLSSNGVIDKKYIQAAEYLVSLKQTDSNCYRIITNDSGERDLGNGDSNMKFTCTAKGNPGGDYFSLNKEFGYRNSHNASSWYGKTFEAAFVDVVNGTSLGRQKVASWSRYSESHWYWTDDEHWAFVNNENNYFFSIDILKN